MSIGRPHFKASGKSMKLAIIKKGDFDKQKWGPQATRQTRDKIGALP